MSYPIQTIHQFIDLRSKGQSLCHISEELKVPQSTLGDWNQRHADQIALQRAMNWERCEAYAQLACEKDLIRLASFIHHCQNELEQRSLKRFSNSELVRLLFSARRDYFKRRDPLLAPLERPRSVVAADVRRLKYRRSPAPFDPSKLDSSNKPDKTGQKPDAFPNRLNGNHLHEPRFPSGSVTPDLRAKPRCKTESNSRGLISSEPSANPNPSSADAVQGDPPNQSPFTVNLKECLR